MNVFSLRCRVELGAPHVMGSALANECLPNTASDAEEGDAWQFFNSLGLSPFSQEPDHLVPVGIVPGSSDGRRGIGRKGQHLTPNLRAAFCFPRVVRTGAGQWQSGQTRQDGRLEFYQMAPSLEAVRMMSICSSYL